MPAIFFKAVPFSKEEVTLALESGVDGVICPRSECELVAGLSRCNVLAAEDVPSIALTCKEDEQTYLDACRSGMCTLAPGWEIIPVENLLAQSDAVYAEARSLKEAELASGILERGVSGVVVLPEGCADLKEIVKSCKISLAHEELVEAEVTEVRQVGLGHRVCVDTISMLRRGQGMLVGNSSDFTFLVHAETEHNEYVAARPFRINAGAVHAYTRLPHDRTCYLEELRAGSEVQIVDSTGRTMIASVGRIKLEVRPMLLVRASVKTAEGEKSGAVFLQNAETIRVTAPGGIPVSVVSLKPGDKILVRTDVAGRHFGMRIKEEIAEV
ncbi:MAG: 3-dehydroquinate synthase II family protein [Desulfovibrionaceae bacterium]|nr:3-dehydroquinate synthase II family protein [Desulfovibrionaceae bacterium]